MRKRWTRAAGIAVALSASASRANPTDAFLQYQTGVVAVTYYVETNVMHEVREVGGRDVGVLVEPDLVVVNGAITTSSTTGAQPHDFKVHFFSGEERGAAFVGRDEFANLAFLRLIEKAPAGARPLQFGGKTPVLRVGDQVFTIGL